MKKIVSILLVCLMLLMPFTVLAAYEVEDQEQEGIHSAGSFSEFAEDIGHGFQSGTFMSVGNPQEIFNVIDSHHAPFEYVMSLVNLIAVIVAVFVIMVYGVQWLTASSQKKQQLKAALLPMSIGLALIIVGPRLAMIVINVVVEMAH